MPTATIDRERAEKKIKTLFGWLFFRRISLPLALLLGCTHVLFPPGQITARRRALLQTVVMLGVRLQN